MSKFGTTTPEHLASIKVEAALHFGPMVLHEALLRLCHAQGSESLDKFQKSMVDRIDRMQGDGADFEEMKEFAIELVYACIREVKQSPNFRHPLENMTARRTQGRSEEAGTLEEQLQAGLEDTFPASDPPAVVSTAISGGSDKLVGTDEVLRQKREAGEAERK